MPSIRSFVQERNWRGLTQHIRQQVPERRLSGLAAAVSEIEKQIPEVQDRRRFLSVVTWSEFLRILKEHPISPSPRGLTRGIRVLEGCLHRGECILEDLPALVDRFTQRRPMNRSQYFRTARLLERVSNHTLANSKTKDQAEKVLGFLKSRIKPR